MLKFIISSSSKLEKHFFVFSIVFMSYFEFILFIIVNYNTLSVISCHILFILNGFNFFFMNYIKNKQLGKLALIEGTIAVN